MRPLKDYAPFTVGERFEDTWGNELVTTGGHSYKYNCGGWQETTEAEVAFKEATGKDSMDLTYPRIKRKEIEDIMCIVT